ncbi:uncharacterized protein [Diabrotica undecimpunctata]|uniref:uncharacterized protein n=1 Tax=Diabrotica undecimpunctata TaxID=50387 RepID=UPI003B642A99
MTSVTVVLDKDKKHQYKDYVNFLGSYKNGKKSESDNNSSLNSSVSDLNDLNEMPTKSFNEYLKDYNTKKFQPVQPAFTKKEEAPKNVKTEVFIQINNTKNANNNSQIQVTLPKPKLDETDGEQIKISVGELSQKFSNTSLHNNKTQTHILKRSSSITEKTKIFEENQDENRKLITKINKANHIEKFPKKVQTATKKPNQTFIEIRKQELQNSPKTNGAVSPPPGKIDVAKFSSQLEHSINNSSTVPAKYSQEVCSEVPIEPITVEAQESIIKIEIPVSNSAIPPPPPPPLPPANLPPRPVITSPKVSNSSPKSFHQLPKSPVSNGYSTLPRTGHNTLPRTQNQASDATLNRNDPRVKKLVYGALQGMYGAYHDKANDYLATLPKNRVKKGNGLDSIINSIAAQGGLDKLCGRAIPKSETESVEANIII